MCEQSEPIPLRVAVFPLPGVVLFPRSVIPLHLFEDRYRAMARDVLAGNRIMALALLKPGFEPLYYTSRAPIHPVIGVGRIVAAEQVDGGRYNILLQGVARAKVIEQVQDDPYRVAEIEPLTTTTPTVDGECAQLQHELKNIITGDPALDPQQRHRWLEWLDKPLSIAEKADLIAADLCLNAELRQPLMEELNGIRRACRLIDILKTCSDVRATRRRSGSGRCGSCN